MLTLIGKILNIVYHDSNQPDPRVFTSMIPAAIDAVASGVV